MRSVIILAGGLGTRLRSAIGDLPKPLAPVQGKPFLWYILNQIAQTDIQNIYLSLCYQAEKIIETLSRYQFPFSIKYSVEPEPLGTGGAIKFVMSQFNLDNAIIINGDTFFGIDFQNFPTPLLKENSDIIIASPYLKECSRYGSLNISEDQIIAFQEKEVDKAGWINGGIYFIKKTVWERNKLPLAFSFERYVEENIAHLNVKVQKFPNTSFIDIGIPVDYHKFIDQISIDSASS